MGVTAPPSVADSVVDVATSHRKVVDGASLQRFVSTMMLTLLLRKICEQMRRVVRQLVRYKTIRN